ncbi:hypothetical protein [Kineococcus sp. SYSU DK002]|uniref:hypothetical protein n=1 Tax=Kineococcus sp. SYSU DK002 TaxID=3383123 RepID=UPI003D7CD40C
MFHHRVHRRVHRDTRYRLRTAALTAPALLAATAAALATAGPAAATPRPATGALSVRDAVVTLHSPAQAKPLTDDCWTGWSGALCGYGEVAFTLTGFDAHGGVPSCDPEDAGYSETCEEPVAELVETRGTRVDLVVRCAGKLLPRVASVPVVTEPTHLVGPADVSAFNRIDSDSARVAVLFYFPTPSQVAVCGGGATEVVAASARNVTVGWAGTGTSVPAGTHRVPGLHRFRLR